MSRDIPATPDEPRASAAPGEPIRREVCPRCGRSSARLIGRSTTFAALYLRCDECHHTSVSPA